MSRFPLLAALAMLAACTARRPAAAQPQAVSAGPAPSTATPATRVAIAEVLRIADTHKNTALTRRRFTHTEFWRAIQPSLSSPRLQLEAVGRSLLGRELRTVSFGTGPVTVLLWSQMHGDESTATMALADIIAWLAAPESDAFRDRLASSLTVVMLPMLNPDGAERFQRENAVGIDVNRDARRLATPEAGVLKALRDRLRPAFGFNLHDQNARTRVGRNGPPAAFALLAPAADPEKAWGPGRARARLVAAGIARDLNGQFAGRVAKYDDAFNARAFGDLMQTWGTSTVLIESGALPDDPEKQALRRLNVLAMLRALDAIATRGYELADPSDYEQLAFNAGGAYDLLIRGGHLVLPGLPPLLADLAINYDDAVAKTGGRVREVGDLTGAVALDTLDATGAFLHPRPEALQLVRGQPYLTIGARAALDLRASAEPGSALRRRIE